MLRGLEARGWLTLEVAQAGRHHAEWLDHWLRDSSADLLVFVDSDVEFRQAGWLRELVCAAMQLGAALVAAEMLPEFREFAVPVAPSPEDQELFAEWFKGRRTVRLAPRPAPWLFLVDPGQVAPIGIGFGFHSELAAIPEGVLAFDVGGALHRALERQGLLVAAMPPSYSRAYHHYGGLSWVPLRGWRGLKKRRDLVVVRRRLRRLRRLDGPRGAAG